MYCLRHCKADHDDADTGCELGTPTGFDVSMTAGPFTEPSKLVLDINCLFICVWYWCFAFNIGEYILSNILAYCVYRLYLYMCQNAPILIVDCLLRVDEYPDPVACIVPAVYCKDQRSVIHSVTYKY